MNLAIITGIGLIGHAVGYLCVEKDYNQAFTNFMKGLGQFGLHDSIKAAMEAPPGTALPVFPVKPGE